MTTIAAPWHRDEDGTLVAELSDFGPNGPRYPNGTQLNLGFWEKDMDCHGEDIAGWRMNFGGQKYLIIND